MIEYIHYLKSDIYKLRHSWFFPLHILFPICGTLLMLMYAKLSGSSDLNKLAAFSQVIAVAYPFVIAIVCQIISEQEMRAGYFQNMLTLPCRKKAIWSKFTILVLSGLLSCLLCTIIFGMIFSFIENVKIPFAFFILVPAILLGSNILLYALHLILSIQFGRNLSISIGVLGSLLVALMQTGLGTGIWFLIPYGLGVHFLETALNYIFITPEVISGEIRVGIYFCIIATCAIMGIMTFWFSKYSGTHSE